MSFELELLLSVVDVVVCGAAILVVDYDGDDVVVVVAAADVADNCFHFFLFAVLEHCISTV